MEIYYVLFCLLFCSSIWELFVKPKSNFFLYLWILYLIVFVGFRYNVGNDFYAYYINFIEINRGGDYITSEPLYILINKLAPSYEWVIFFFSFFSFYFLYKFIFYFNERYAIFALFLYYSLFLINYNIHIFRQGLAISIVLWAFIYLYKDKKWNFFLAVILASLFHLSALILLPFMFIIKKDIPIKIQLIVLIIAFLIGLNASSLVSLYYDIVNNIPILNKYTKFYREEEVKSYEFSLGMLADIAILLMFMFKYKYLAGKDLFLYRIFYISVILSLVLMIEPTSLRMNYYFRTVIILMIPLLFKYYKNKKLIIMVFAFILTYGYLDKTFNSISEYGRTDRNLKYKTIFYKND